MKQKLLNFTRLRSLVLLAVIAFLGAGQAWGQSTDGYTATSGDKPAATNGTTTGTVTGTNSINWSYSVTQTTASGKNPYAAYSDASGWQLGSGNSPCTAFSISTSGISGTITQIDVVTGSKSASSSISVTVGGNAFGTQNQATGSGSTVTTQTFTGSASGEIVISASASSAAFYFKSVTVTYTTGSVTPTCATPIFSPAAGVYTSTQNVTITSETSGATIYYTTNGNDPTTGSSVYSSAISVSSTTTIKAIAVKNGMDDSSVASATFTILNLSHAGTAADPYSVADARTYLNAQSPVNDVYVKGKISQIDSYSNNTITYWISDDGTTTNQFEVYRGKGLNGANFSSTSDLSLGAEVVVSGNIKLYNNSVYEFDSNSSIYSMTAAAVEAPAFSVAGGVYYAAQNVELTCATSGASIKYSTDGTTWSDYSSALTISTTTTLYAKAVSGSTESAVVNASYTIRDANALGGPQNPYTVAQALAASPTENIYVTGIISSITEVNTQYGNATYNISDDGTTSGQMIVYRGNYLENASFTSTDQIAEGDNVVVCGDLIVHNEANQLASGNHIVSLTRPVVPVINAIDVDIDYDATSGEIPYSIDNVAVGTHLTSATTAADWVSNIVIGDSEVSFDCTVNTGDADRTATFTLTYTGAESKSITVTQKHYVEMYNGTGTFIKVTSVNDLEDGGYYVLTYNSHALKASYYGSTTNEMASASVTAANDEIINPATDIVWKLEANGGNWNLYNETAGKYCNITANSTTGFSLSETATAYVASLSNDAFTFATTATGGRCIAYYSSNSSFRSYASNNAGASLTLYKLGQASSTPSITVDPATVDVDATATDPQIGIGGTLDISYTNLTVSDMTDFYVQFYDAESNEISQPTWIEDVLVAEQDPQVGEGYVVSYTIEDNDGDARTAYFKVYVGQTYSNLVTITQAAYVAPPTPVAGSFVLTDLANINANDVFVIVGNNGDPYAMSNDNGTSKAPDAVEVTIQNDVITSDCYNNILWNISGNATDGYTFYPNGDSEKWLYCTNSNNGVRVGTNDNKVFKLDDESGYLINDATSRYVGIYNSSDWRCYTNTTGNIANQTFTFYKQLAAKLNGNGYATFSATVPVDYSQATDFTAWAIASISGETITFQQITGAVPANTGVLLMGDAGEYVYPTIATTTGTTVTNLLVGISTATTITTDQYYGLSGNTFVKVNAGIVPAGKALLPATHVDGSGAKAFTFVFEGADGIKTVEHVSAEEAAEIFNLAGQRMSKPQRGVNIINGKKVLVK